MSGRDRKQIKILIVLLVILGLTLFLAPRINRPSTASVAPGSAEPRQESPAPAAVSDARIRLDLIDGDVGRQDAGGQNVFQYRTTAVAPQFPPPGEHKPLNDPFAAAQPAIVNAAPPAPTGPPPPPPLTLKYQGFAKGNDGSGEITAFLVDSPNPVSTEFSPHYNVKAGDVLLGRYRIVAVTDASVQVQDLQYDRRQVLPLLKP